MVMQLTHFWDRGDGARIGWMHRPPVRSIHGQHQVRAPAVIIIGVSRDKAAEMGFADHDYVIQAVSPDAPDDALHIGIRMRRQLRRIVTLRRDGSVSPTRTIRSTSTSLT